MTIVAAMSCNGLALLGSNTGFTTARSSVIDNGEAPWIFFQEWALGVTGSMLALNVIRSGLSSIVNDLKSPGQVMVEVGKILSEYDIGRKDAGETTWGFDIWCILAHRSGKIWDVDERLSLAPMPEGYLWARGSGEQYAIGAASALRRLDHELSPEEIVKLSIQSAIDNDIFSPGSLFYRTL